MSKYLTAVIGVLVGIIGILAGLFTSTNTKKKVAEEKAENTAKGLQASEDIAKVVAEPTVINKVEKKAGKLGKMAILFVLSYSIVGCAYYEPICPALVKIEKPGNFKEITYKYDEKVGFIFDDENMEQLNTQFSWAKQTISKYERQIDIYNQTIKGVNQK